MRKSLRYNFFESIFMALYYHVLMTPPFFLVPKTVNTSDHDWFGHYFLNSHSVEVIVRSKMGKSYLGLWRGEK